MTDLSFLPRLNAGLNGTCALFLAAGFFFIKKKRVNLHKFCMLTAFAVSSLFLVSYLYYHSQVGATRFTGTGWTRPVYFSVLISHTVLATAVLPMALAVLYKAWRRDFTTHVRWARWTWPVWMYVSVTGVLIYGMLYHLYPG